MTELLAKMFIKDHKNINDPAVRSAYGKMAGAAGIVTNVLLCAGKFAVGVISGSMSVAADAVNNLSDAASGVIGLLGFKLAEKNADPEHPYGHGRYEYLAGFIVAALIMVIGVELLRDSIVKIISPSEVNFGLVTVLVLAFSILAKIMLMLFNRNIGRKINSETLIAAAADSRNDVISTAAVLTALVISHFCNIQLDGIMGALVAAFILYSGAGLVKDAMNPLLGKAPTIEQAERIREKILSYEGVLGTHDLMIHDYGPGRQFASAHVEVPADMSLVRCHTIIDTIERDFLREGLNMLIHADPIESSNSVLEEINRIVREIDERITVHDMRIVHCAGEDKVIFDCVLPPESGLEENSVSEEITRFLRLKYPKSRCVISFEDSYASIPKSRGED